MKSAATANLAPAIIAAKIIFVVHSAEGKERLLKMATTQTQKMPCGDIYPLDTTCLGMYVTGSVGKTRLAKFCKKCTIFSGEDLEAL